VLASDLRWRAELILALPGNQGALVGYSLPMGGFLASHGVDAFIFWRAVATRCLPRQPRFWMRSLAGAVLLLAGVRWRSGRTSRGFTPHRRRRCRERP